MGGLFLPDEIGEKEQGVYSQISESAPLSKNHFLLHHLSSNVFEEEIEGVHVLQAEGGYLTRYYDRLVQMAKK